VMERPKIFISGDTLVVENQRVNGGVS
jgi:hypothetical protein